MVADVHKQSTSTERIHIMAKIIGAPGRYIQGPGVINSIGEHIKKMANSALVIISASGKKRVGVDIRTALDAEGINYMFAESVGECSRDEIERLCKVASANDSDIIIGVGGGKILDTSKAVAYYEGLPVMIVPTIAATDAPCSALSIIYTPDGTVESFLFYPQNPDLVLVDSQIIAKAPVRLLVSGMGDALATFFEAKSAALKGADNTLGGPATLAALALAELCYNTLLEQGLKAKLAVIAGDLTPAVEKIIEVNTYLSGIGFESGGLAGAHAIHNGFVACEETKGSYHGEKVAFGTIVQLVLEDYPKEEIKEVIEFCLAVGLPVTLKDLGITEPYEAKLRKVAAVACADDETIYNMAVSVTPNDVQRAILTADALGREYKL
jgi:glycerol dehydrogenase